MTSEKASVDYSPKRNYRVEIGEDTASGAFFHIAHPPTSFAGPEVASLNREQARELHEKLGVMLDE